MPQRFVLSCLTALTLVAGLAAQGASPAKLSHPADAQTAHPKVHVEGCLFIEQELTAPAPMLVTMEGTYAWVLTNVKPIAGPLTEDEAAKTTYTLGKIDQQELRTFHGKRVGIVGTVAPGGARPTLEVVSIREISGGCPTLPRIMS